MSEEQEEQIEEFLEEEDRQEEPLPRGRGKGKKRAREEKDEEAQNEEQEEKAVPKRKRQPKNETIDDKLGVLGITLDLGSVAQSFQDVLMNSQTDDYGFKHTPSSTNTLCKKGIRALFNSIAAILEVSPNTLCSTDMEIAEEKSKAIKEAAQERFQLSDSRHAPAAIRVCAALPCFHGKNSVLHEILEEHAIKCQKGNQKRRKANIKIHITEREKRKRAAAPSLPSLPSSSSLAQNAALLGVFNNRPDSQSQSQNESVGSAAAPSPSLSFLRDGEEA